MEFNWQAGVIRVTCKLFPDFLTLSENNAVLAKRFLESGLKFGLKFGFVPFIIWFMVKLGMSSLSFFWYSKVLVTFFNSIGMFLFLGNLCFFCMIYIFAVILRFHKSFWLWGLLLIFFMVLALFVVIYVDWDTFHSFWASRDNTNSTVE